MKIHPKTDLKRHQKIDQFWDRCFIDFGRVLGSNLDPCWPPRRPKTPPKPLQDASKTTQVRPPRHLSPVSKTGGGGYPMGPWRILEVLSPRAHGVPPPGLDSMLILRASAVAGSQLCCALDIIVYNYFITKL